MDHEPHPKVMQATLHVSSRVHFSRQTMPSDHLRQLCGINASMDITIELDHMVLLFVTVARLNVINTLLSPLVTRCDDG